MVCAVAEGGSFGREGANRFSLQGQWRVRDSSLGDRIIVHLLRRDGITDSRCVDGNRGPVCRSRVSKAGTRSYLYAPREDAGHLRSLPPSRRRRRRLRGSLILCHASGRSESSENDKGLVRSAHSRGAERPWRLSCKLLKRQWSLSSSERAAFVLEGRCRDAG